MDRGSGTTRRLDQSPTAPESERVRPDAMAASPSDTEIRADPRSPDPDLHQTAAADVQADAEAGAQPEDSSGRIEPLKRR
ncbi:hypothetical protein [Antarcticirhabdus aurantiaca]|uniref:Uncharacterized protein n=1 Tax=Antarcticirhabdus aurantiaca TaxID=2606717 RepID=A0ACD4NQH2_9HYPH|nr:hypothetical protein [Antarcticirhabdus aurantiaca]WAJ29085.1 hypothetical protein OXU80_02245 [Jeongeuplla avenae]